MNCLVLMLDKNNLTKKLTIMKNKFRRKIEDDLIEYFANSMTSHQLITENISAFGEISNEIEENICNLLAHSQRGWDAIECDAEGATASQDAEMDKFLKQVAQEIIEQIKKMKL